MVNQKNITPNHSLSFGSRMYFISSAISLFNSFILMLLVFYLYSYLYNL